MWRLCSDSGSAGGPLLISRCHGLAALGPAMVAMGVVSLPGAWAMQQWIPPLPDQ